MGLAVIEAFGPPDYGRMKGYEGLVGHTLENHDISIEAALATAGWQAGAGNTSGGSYHGILGYDDDLGPPSSPDAWVLVKTVPFRRIAGSISTRRDAIWAPERYPWLAQLLSDAAYADPNAYLHALALSGDAKWWSGTLATPEGRAKYRGMLISFARWVRRLERTFVYDSVLSQHRHWQTNRSDVDGLEFMDWVLDEYEQLGQPQPASTTELEARILTLEEDLAAAQRSTRRLRRRLAAKDAELDTIVAAAGRGREA